MLAGYRTYIAAIIAALLHGAVVLGFVSDEESKQITTALAGAFDAATLIFLRLGIAAKS